MQMFERALDRLDRGLARGDGLELLVELVIRVVLGLDDTLRDELRRDAVEAAFGRREGAVWDPRTYVAYDDELLTDGQRWIANRRRELPPNGSREDPLDELLGAAPE